LLTHSIPVIATTLALKINNLQATIAGRKIPTQKIQQLTDSRMCDRRTVPR
jgi:hypothetical protein